MIEKMRKIISIIGILACLSMIECKRVSPTIRMSQIKRNNNLLYVTKFAMDIGRGEFTARAKFNLNYFTPSSDEIVNVGFSVIVDDQWRADKTEITCSNLRSRSSVNNRFEIPKNSTFSKEIKAGLHSRRRRHVWFFVIHDCDNNLSQASQFSLIDLELDIYNVDGSHFPTDEGNFVWYYFALFCGFSYLFFKNVRELLNKYRRSEEMEWPLCLIEISVGFWALNNFMNFLHWYIYGYNGQGFFLFDLISQISSNLTGFILNIVLILLSWGWTINHLSQDFYDILIPLSVIMGVIQCMIVGLGKLTDDSFTKYHQYDGWAGYTILILRLGLTIYFAFGIKNTLKASKEKVKSFIQQLGFFGILYFLTFPILLLISNFIAPYVQHKVMKIGLLILESGTLILLHFLFTSKKTEYYKISQSGNTLLPNFKSN